MADPLLIATIAKIQDDLVYVIEELLRDYTGEARGELVEMLHRLDAQAAVLGADFAGRLRDQLAPELSRLRGVERGAAHGALIDLRRGLRNVQLRLQGQQDTYPYGTELGWPGEAGAAPAPH